LQTRIVSLFAASLAVLATAAGCSRGTTDSHHAAGATSTPAPLQVRVEQSGLGPILTDQDGRTLYAFVHDKDGAGTCTGDCVATWPALAGRQAATAGSGIDGSLVSQTGQAEGTVQTTYNNWPLYYYVGDTGPGDVDGQGVDGAWFVLGPDGKLIRTQTSV